MPRDFAERVEAPIAYSASIANTVAARAWVAITRRHLKYGAPHGLTWSEVQIQE
jgi:hypothetical protein